ncbi:hypothetical protein [Sphingomonas sp. SORGH_AS_0879]|uniref:hypothetical protein n=1 Tax=Sphingomonas sp. SORGH_AS_0879 TaxID=3041790 RepID=UPI0027865748|nr:hypothetical protein [Sphingomonas sp. SORGH_AS_0879]MDQ1231375.1 succinoglycan biosynthesis protein ExoV [Sphingomonas sp. SORGH_AS_0879]
MKLEYSRPGSHGNFGDDLNEWFWDEVAPGLLDDDDSTILLGMGTIFSRWFTDQLPADSQKIVIGSGGGKAGGPPHLDDKWHIYGVRGPLTAAYSGLGQETVLTDPAMLLRDFPEFSDLGPRRGIGFMPHIWSLDHWDWEKTTRELGLEFINPRDEAKGTVRRIGRLEGLITEAMHGAIVADAFRTPWIAVGIAPGFETSKWCDWAASLGMAMTFHSVRDVYAPKRSTSLRIIKGAIKEGLHRVGIKAGKRARPRSGEWDVADMKGRLRSLIEQKPYQLSDEAKLDAALERTRQAIARLRQDAASGKFARK